MRNRQNSGWASLPVATTGRLLCRELTFQNEYLRILAEGPSVDYATAKPVDRDGPVGKGECLDISIAPFAEPGKYYHIIVGPQPGAIYDAAYGFVTESIDARREGRHHLERQLAVHL